MSLDVCLKSRVATKKECLHCGSEYKEFETLYDANITHNLGAMAEAAGIYKHLWCPEEIGIYAAGDLIVPLEKAIADMERRPQFYKQFNAKNGWGTYDNFLPWIRKYINACREYPNAKIEVSR